MNNAFWKLKPYWAAALVIAVTSSSVTHSAWANPGDVLSRDAFIEHYCYECHDDVISESDLDLSSTAFNPENKESFAFWEKVFNRVKAGEMPPDDGETPLDSHLDPFVEEMGTILAETDRARVAQRITAQLGASRG